MTTPKSFPWPKHFQVHAQPLKRLFGGQTLQDKPWLKQNEKHTKEMWKLQHNFETMDNNKNDFYMVKFDQVADKEKTISNGPWMIYYRGLLLVTTIYLSVCKSRSHNNMSDSTSSTKSMVDMATLTKIVIWKNNQPN